MDVVMATKRIATLQQRLYLVVSNALVAQCERAKESLSDYDRAEVSVMHPDTGRDGAGLQRCGSPACLRGLGLVQGWVES